MEMAKGSPPNSTLHPMKVLFLIPKNPAPQLDGNFSRPFKEFIALCLNKDPADVCVVRVLLLSHVDISVTELWVEFFVCFVVDLMVETYGKRPCKTQVRQRWEENFTSS